MNFRSQQFEYNPATKTYVADASDLQIGTPGEYISIDGYAFVFTYSDMDSSGEDTYGWRYKPTGNSISLNSALAYCTALIIND